MRPPEVVIMDLVSQWLQKAEQDFGAAEHLLSAGVSYLAAVGFHAQQAAEKFLKAVLVHHQIEFPKTHNLSDLLDLIARADPSLASSLRDIVSLNPYGIDVRYPGDIPEPTEQDASEAVRLAGRVRDAVRLRLT